MALWVIGTMWAVPWAVVWVSVGEVLTGECAGEEGGLLEVE